MTKKQFKDLAKKHLFVLESYKTNKDGIKKLEIFGFDELYEQLTKIAKMNYKKIDFCGHLYHFWQYGKKSIIMHDTGYEEKSLKEEIIENGFVISETDIYTIDPEHFIKQHFVNKTVI